MHVRLVIAQGVSKTLQTISAVLPKHTRRLVLWGALYSKMCGGQSLTKEQTERLNNTLSLCKDSSALVLPGILGKYLWSDLDHCSTAVKNAICNEANAEEAALSFVHHVPSFLRYASDAFTLNDFQSLLATHRQAIHGAT